MARKSLLDKELPAGPKRTITVREKVLLLVRGGNKLAAALSTCGVTRQRLHEWRGLAANGSKKYIEFFEAAQRAVDESEVNDVVVTARAASLDQTELTCTRCGTPVRITSDEMLAAAGALAAAQRVKASAAQVAFQRLALRNPAQWSPRVVHTVEEEHNRLLDVAQRILAPEVFRALLEAYLAQDDGEGEAAVAGGEPPTGGVH